MYLAFTFSFAFLCNAGVNTPDHSVMFGNLIIMLRERVTPLVAILKSKDCQNVKGILGRTLSQLLDNPDMVSVSACICCSCVDIRKMSVLMLSWRNKKKYCYFSVKKAPHLELCSPQIHLVLIIL